jgi:hypothetical protein
MTMAKASMTASLLLNFISFSSRFPVKTTICALHALVNPIIFFSGNRVQMEQYPNSRRQTARDNLTFLGYPNICVIPDKVVNFTIVKVCDPYIYLKGDFSMRSKRIAGVLLAVVLAFPLALPLNVHAATRFTDTSGHWAENYINTAVSKNIITGYPDGRFKPNKAVSRAEFCAMINKALGNTGMADISFSDANRGNWYYNDITKAVAAAYTAGYSDNTFRPDNPITRQEAAVMISRIVPSYGSGKNMSAYSDSGNIASWAYDAMEKVCGKGYMGAYNDGLIHPQDNLTRAQTAKIICDIMDKETIVTSNTTIDDDGARLSGRIYANIVTIDKDLDDGSASIENCVILGTLIVNGGGTNTVTVSSSRVVNANVKKDDSPVRLLAKGETSILNLTAYNESILQTSGLSGGTFGSGFNGITVAGSADVTLKGGTFPKVNTSGSKATLTLSAGTISDLVVNGRYSSITADSGATISTATVNSESYFHGSGTISKMNVNADNVTYETKPRSWSISSSAETPTQSDTASGDITFSPKNAVTNVKLDVSPTLTFDYAVEMQDGDAITSSDIEDFVELRKGSSTGNLVEFAGTINSSKKVITINPDSDLAKDTKYYLILNDNAIQREGGKDIDKQTSYFTTGSNTGTLTTSFTPADGATLVSTNPSITIKFSEAVVRYSNGTSISTSDSYLKDCITFRNNNSSGDKVSFTASIDTDKKVITISPSSSLALNQKYYLALGSNMLKTKSEGTTIPASSVTWTTGVVTPVLSSFNISAGDTSVTTSMTPNVAGKIYAVVVPSGASAPSAIQIAAGQNSSGTAALGSAKNESAAASTQVTLPSMGGFVSGTSYDLWATLYSNASGTYSAPVKQSFTTTVPKIYLSGLTVKPIISSAAGSDQISFRFGTNSYSVSLNSSITSVEIKADGASGSAITMASSGIGTQSGTGSFTALVDIAANPTVTVTISAPRSTASSYTINLSSVNDTSLRQLTIKDSSPSLGDMSFSYALSTSGAVSIPLEIKTKDPYAIVSVPVGSGVSVSTTENKAGSASYNLSFSEGTMPTAIQFSVTSGSSTSSPYTITFTRPQPDPLPPVQPEQPTQPEQPQTQPLK